MYRYGLSKTSARLVSIFPLSAFTATWVVVNSRPAASPSRMPWCDFERPRLQEMTSATPMVASAASNASIATTE